MHLPAALQGAAVECAFSQGRLQVTLSHSQLGLARQVLAWVAVQSSLHTELVPSHTQVEVGQVGWVVKVLQAGTQVLLALQRQVGTAPQLVTSTRLLQVV
jgi:hypothetical protein